MAQKSGQSMQIQYGVVVGSKHVKEQSNAGKGALVGGAIGLYAGKGKSIIPNPIKSGLQCYLQPIYMYFVNLMKVLIKI